MPEPKTTPTDRLTVRHMFACRFDSTKLPEGVGSANDEPDDEGKVGVLVTNDNVHQLWPLIPAERQTELIDGRYVIVLYGRGSKVEPTTRSGDPAGTDPDEAAGARRVRGRG
jgi:hypothetical protein